MTTLASLTPCGECQCCKAGRRCARVLLLSPDDESKLRRVFAVLGGEPSGRTIQLRTDIARAQARGEPPEPMSSVSCSRCREDFELPTYIVATFKAGRFSLPTCEPCRYQGKERADLA